MTHEFVGRRRKVVIPFPNSVCEEAEVQKIKFDIDWIPFGVHIYVAKDLKKYDGLMMHKHCGEYYKLWSKYKIKTPSIFFSEKLLSTPKRLKWVLLHEIGHHLMSKVGEEHMAKATRKEKTPLTKVENEATMAGKMWGHLFLVKENKSDSEELKEGYVF